MRSKPSNAPSTRSNGPAERLTLLCEPAAGHPGGSPLGHLGSARHEGRRRNRLIWRPRRVGAPPAVSGQERPGRSAPGIVTTGAPPAGLEPAPPAPEAGALSAELRGRAAQDARPSQGQGTSVVPVGGLRIPT